MLYALSQKNFHDYYYSFYSLNQLSKTLHQIFRKAALGRVRDNKTEIAITEDNLHQFVGNPKWTRYWVFLEKKKDLFVRLFRLFVCYYYDYYYCYFFYYFYLLLLLPFFLLIMRFPCFPLFSRAQRPPVRRDPARHCHGPRLDCHGCVSLLFLSIIFHHVFKKVFSFFFFGRRLGVVHRNSRDPDALKGQGLTPGTLLHCYRLVTECCLLFFFVF